MSLTNQTLARLPTIKQGLTQGISRGEIGKQCGVTEKTIDRDVTAWINSGLFEQWIREEFVRLHPTMVRVYPEIAYRELARLMGKMIIQKREITETVQEEITYNVFTDDEKSILDRAARLLEAKGARKSSDFH